RRVPRCRHGADPGTRGARRQPHRGHHHPVADAYRRPAALGPTGGTPARRRHRAGLRRAHRTDRRDDDMTVQLRGITWDHERGRASIEAASRAYAQSHDVSVEWHSRSLQAFADQGLESLTAGYDLLVIDHPHIPEAAEAGLLAE